MVIEPLVQLSNRLSQSGKRRRMLMLSRIAMSIVVVGLVIFVASCSTATPEYLSSKTPGFTETSIPNPTSTSTPVPMMTPTPSITPNLYGTPIDLLTIAEGDSLFQPINVPVTFIAAFEELPSGLYTVLRIVDPDKRIEEFMYASIDSGQQGRLIFVNEILNLEYSYFELDRTWIVGGYPGTALRYLFDLTNQKAYQFPICHERHPVELSPSGHRLALICTEREMIQGGEIVIEVISLIDGTAIHLQIPYHSDKRSASNKIHWVSDDSFIALVGPDEEPCLINIPYQGLCCAPILKGKPILSVSPNGTWLLVNRSHGAVWIKDIHLTECFGNENKCEPIITLDDEPTSSGSMYWSPDERKLGVIISAGMGSLTSKIGYYDTNTWLYQPLATLSGDYLFIDWCPDSSCILIRKNAETSGYVSFVDGDLMPLMSDGFTLELIEVP